MPWFDYSVRANWFTDADCTIPTTDPAAVRYVKCIESDATEHLPSGLHVDDHGRPCKKVQAGEIYQMASGGAVSDEKFRRIERQMMERMKRK
jgi:hypothetical protein